MKNVLLFAVAFLSTQTGARAAIDLAKLPPAATRKIDFVKEVQPLFADHCYTCHGPKKQEAALRWDQKAAALKGGESGPAIVPGKSAESLLIHAVSRLRDDLKMPKKGEPLSAEEVGVLRAWIDQGANWPDSPNAPLAKDPKKHWAFTAPVRPNVPEVVEKNWARNPIDHFIGAKLAKSKLKPSAETDPITLLRRLSLDLIGLPPTIAEVDAFLADKAPDAYQKQIERLLASPHYGERWGRHWLDAARYADSDGFEKDMSRNVWMYRDWVINSFNRDLPYDEFVLEQIAGDQLPNATQDQIVATGFLRNSMRNEEGGIDPEQFRMEGMFDRMDCIGKSVLGITIQCAQCHTHKFDPISQEEYYRMFAFLNNDNEPMSAVYSPEELMQRENLSRQMREIESDLQHRSPDWIDRMAKWENEVSANLPEWTILRATVDDISTGGQKYVPQEDGSFLAQGYKPTKHIVRLNVDTKLTNITAFRIELLTDPNLPFNGPGRSFKGTCALTELKIEAGDVASPATKTSVKLASATADYSNPETVLESNFDDRTDRRRVTGPAAFAIDGATETAWGIDAGPGRRNQERKAVFVCATNLVSSNGISLNFQINQSHGGWNSDDHMNNNLGRFRISATSATNPVADPVPKKLRDIFAVPREKRSPMQIAAVFSYWRTTVPEWKEANDKIESLWQQWPAGTSALTLMAREEVRPTKMLQRGDWMKPGKTVTPGVPEFLHPLPKDAPMNRLTFGRWLVDKKSPTTARVMVNRIWQNYFGIGLVDTPEDFGMQSEAPSHPELLDWLACEFMDSGWSLKKMHRLIVTSATYRQSSKVTPELYEVDQYNRLLARGPRFRVEGEIVRDITLAASGLLTDKVGGPSIFSPAPAHLFQPPASYGPFTWTEATGPDRYRRALYTFRRRSTPYPILQSFDVPNGDASCVRRLRSNTPLQALMTLNETLSMECAQALAQKILAEGGTTDAAKIEYAFRRTLSRKPTQEETAELLALVEKQRKRIGEGWVNPNELSTGKPELPANLPSGATPTQLAAYTVVSRVLLNLDETITKE